MKYATMVYRMDAGTLVNKVIEAEDVHDAVKAGWCRSPVEAQEVKKKPRKRAAPRVAKVVNVVAKQ